MNMSETCESLLCDSEAEYIDRMGNVICQECIEEEVESGDAEWEEFEKLTEEDEAFNHCASQKAMVDSINSKLESE